MTLHTANTVCKETICESWSKDRDRSRPKIFLFLDLLYNYHLYFYLLLCVNKQINQTYNQETTTHCSIHSMYLCANILLLFQFYHGKTINNKHYTIIKLSRFKIDITINLDIIWSFIFHSKCILVIIIWNVCDSVSTNIVWCLKTSSMRCTYKMV